MDRTTDRVSSVHYRQSVLDNCLVTEGEGIKGVTWEGIGVGKITGNTSLVIRTQTRSCE